jgi:hypothetical protein
VLCLLVTEKLSMISQNLDFAAEYSFFITQVSLKKPRCLKFITLSDQITCDKLSGKQLSRDPNRRSVAQQGRHW